MQGGREGAVGGSLPARSLLPLFLGGPLLRLPAKSSAARRLTSTSADTATLPPPCRPAARPRLRRPSSRRLSSRGRRRPWPRPRPGSTTTSSSASSPCPGARRCASPPSSLRPAKAPSPHGGQDARSETRCADADELHLCRHVASSQAVKLAYLDLLEAHLSERTREAVLDSQDLDDFALDEFPFIAKNCQSAAPLPSAVCSGLDADDCGGRRTRRREHRGRQRVLRRVLRRLRHGRAQPGGRVRVRPRLALSPQDRPGSVQADPGPGCAPAGPS